MQTSPRLSSSSEDTRTRIIAAARAVYEQNGTRGTTTREVAERAGVNEATLFRHFGNKHALLVAMREDACPVAMFDNAIATLSGDLRADLLTISQALIDRMHAQRKMMCISLAEEDTAALVPEWRGPMEIKQRLEAFFAAQVRSGRIRGDVGRLTTYFMGMCVSYVIARKLWESYTIRPADLEFMVDIFLNGVK